MYDFPTFDTPTHAEFTTELGASSPFDDLFDETWRDIYNSIFDRPNFEYRLKNPGGWEAGPDENMDGQPDSYSISCDTDKNGVADGYEARLDTTGNKITDTIIQATDYNEDGTIDSVTVHIDPEGEAHFSQVAKIYDTDGDGRLDKMDYYEDLTGDGQSDIQQTIVLDVPLELEMPSGGYADFPLPGAGVGLFGFGPEQFTPNAAYPEGIVGDPRSSMDVWEYQGQTNRCALYSQKFVIEELTGKEIDMEQFADYAEAHGWFTEDVGTPRLSVGKMLEVYGVEHEVGFHKEISDIEACLQNGGKVIVGVDAYEIWSQADNNIFAPDSGANHAVQVIGIDRSNPATPMVILNDSGSESGRGSMIPEDVFVKAWEDGDCQMISCYAA